MYYYENPWIESLTQCIELWNIREIGNKIFIKFYMKQRYS